MVRFAMIPIAVLAALPLFASGVEGAEQTDLAWLHVVDAGKYALAWQQEAPEAKNMASEQTFVDAVRAVRTPLGAVQSRELMSAQPKQTLPGAPDGSYMIAQYKTQFAAKRDAVETVISMQQPGGTWAVAGYFVR